MVQTNHWALILQLQFYAHSVLTRLFNLFQTTGKAYMRDRVKLQTNKLFALAL